MLKAVGKEGQVEEMGMEGRELKELHLCIEAKLAKGVGKEV